MILNGWRSIGMVAMAMAMAMGCAFVAATAIGVGDPLASVVDITNDFSICVLQVLANPNSNTIFSPYGLVSVIVLIHEGANSSSSSAIQMERVLRLPRHRDLTQLGFRDLHRYLKSYFTSDGFLRGLVLSNPKAILSQSYLKTLKYYGFEPDISVESTTYSSTTGDPSITIQNISSTLSPTLVNVTTMTGERNTIKNIGDGLPDKNVTFANPINNGTAPLNKGIITPMFRPPTKSKQKTTVPGAESHSMVSTTEEVVCPTLDTSAPLPVRVNFETTVDPDRVDVTIYNNFQPPMTTEITTTEQKPETEPTTIREFNQGPSTPTSVIKKSTTNFDRYDSPSNLYEVSETESSMKSPVYAVIETVTADSTEPATVDNTETITKTTTESFITAELITISKATTSVPLVSALSSGQPPSEATSPITTGVENEPVPISLEVTSEMTIEYDFNDVSTTMQSGNNTFNEYLIHTYDNEDYGDKIEPKSSEITKAMSETSFRKAHVEDTTATTIEEMIATQFPETLKEQHLSLGKTATDITGKETQAGKNEEMFVTEDSIVQNQTEKFEVSATEFQPTIVSIQTLSTSQSVTESKTTTNHVRVTNADTEIETTEDTGFIETANQESIKKLREKTKNETFYTGDDSLRRSSTNIINTNQESANVRNNVDKESNFSNSLYEEQTTGEFDARTTAHYGTETLFSDPVTERVIEPHEKINTSEVELDEIPSSNSTVAKSLGKSSLSDANNSTSYLEDYVDELNKTITDDLYFSDDTQLLVNLTDTNVNLSEYFTAVDRDDGSSSGGREKRSINSSAGRHRMANWLEGARYREPSNRWFTGFTGENLVPVLTVRAFLPYADLPSLGAQALQIPLDVDYYTMLILLPRHRMGLKQLLDSLRWCSIRNIIASLRTTPIHAVIPIVAMVHHVDLVDPLVKLGIRDIFDSRKAELTEMSRDPFLHVRSIEQVVTISVREHYGDNRDRWYDASESQIQRHFQATHPFVFFVIDTETKVALVAGTIVDPSLRSPIGK